MYSIPYFYIYNIKEIKGLTKKENKMSKSKIKFRLEV